MNNMNGKRRNFSSFNLINFSSYVLKSNLKFNFDFHLFLFQQFLKGITFKFRIGKYVCESEKEKEKERERE